MPSGPEDRLDSWKEIAGYLKRGVRTVQRWEHSAGLPVRRLSPDRQGSVFAYRSELDASWDARGKADVPACEPEPRDPPQPIPAHHATRVAAIVVLVATSVGLALRGVSPRAGSKAFDPIPLNSDLGSEVEPSFSPDGNQVAYAWDGPTQKNWDIYVKTIGSDSAIRLTRTPEPNAYPSWSPDGRWIAFRRFSPRQKSSQVLLIAPGGGPERLLPGDTRTGGPTAWSPDSRWIVTSSSEPPPGPAGLVAIDVNAGTMRLLTEPASPNWRDSEPAVAPDGLSLVFSRDLGSTSELYLLKLTPDFLPDGKPAQITAHHRWTGMPAFTANGGAVRGLPACRR
jgi:hypothetical protein